MQRSNIFLAIFTIIYSSTSNYCVLCFNKLSDDDYALMPKVFKLDDYDRCMELSNTLYCNVELRLTPLPNLNLTNNNNNNSKLWKIINETMQSEVYYRHDLLRHGYCLPLSCPEISPFYFSTVHNNNNNKDNDNKTRLTKDIEECINRINSFDTKGIKGRIEKLYCHNLSSKAYKIGTFDILVALFLSSFVILVIYASFYEGFARYKPEKEYEALINSPYGKILICFSVIRNYERLTKSNENADTKDLKCIQGIRVLCMIGVILSHTVAAYAISGVYNTKYVEYITYEKPLSMLIMNGWLIVQIFFSISGFLLSYHFFLIFEGAKEVKLIYVLLAFLNRYMRLTPALLICVLFNASWIAHISNGPSWHLAVGREYDFCRRNGWINLLYLNNYWRKEDQCMQQTWYIATDTQLFVISLILMVLIWNYKKYAAKILITSVFLSIFLPIVINYINGMHAIFTFRPEAAVKIFLDSPEFHLAHTSLQANIGGYILGVAGGYLFYKYRGAKLFKKHKVLITIWTGFVTGLPIFIVLSGLFLYGEDVVIPRIWAAIISGTMRPLFALTMVTAIFGLSQKLGWVVRRFLEWNPFEYLGRLTYCVYLIHSIVIRVKYGLIRQPLYASELPMILQIVGDITVSYIFGFFLCMLAEMPMSALQKLFLPSMEDKRIKGLSEKSLQRISTITNSEDKEQSSIQISNISTICGTNEKDNNSIRL